MEELVEGKGLEDGQQLLAGMGVLGESEAFLNGLDLVPDDGDAPHRPAGGPGGEQAHELHFARRLPVAVEGLDVDFIQVGRPRDG